MATRIASRDLRSLYLGSASLTTDAAGARVAEQRYWPYGEVRWASGAMPTDRQYTGQVNDTSTGLYFYNARYYDSRIGRFISADTIVPEPGNPQSLNRLAYVLGNPLAYVDSSGHFSETQMKGWFGDDWRTLFSQVWQNILLLAEFGDALVYGKDQSAHFFFVVGSQGSLAAWNTNTGKPLGEVQIVDLYKKVNTDDIALFRAKWAPLEGGPSSDYEWDSVRRVPYEYSGIDSGPTAPYQYRYVAGSLGYGKNLEFSPRWNLGPESVQLHYHVEVRHHIAGLEMPSTWGGAGIAVTLWDILRGGSGHSAVVGLVVSLFDLLTYDTSYRVVPNTPVVQPIPEPRLHSTPSAP